MNPNVSAVKDKVQRIVASRFSHVELRENGDVSLRQNSAQVFVKCWSSADDGPVFITLTVPLLLRVQPSPELFKHIALHADDLVYGHLSAFEDEKGVNIVFSHLLLGDYLDEQELFAACTEVLANADALDDELKAKFGGLRWNED